MRVDGAALTQGYAELFSWLSDSLVPTLLSSADTQSMTVLNLMLKISGQPNIELVPMTFYFWGYLAVRLVRTYKTVSSSLSVYPP